MGIFTGVVWTWLLRRGMELGGLVGTLVVCFLSLPPSTQDAILQVLSGNWQGVTLGALAPIALAVWGYAWSFRATTKDQVVSAGQKVTIKELPAATQTLVKEKAATVVERRKTLADILKSAFGGK